MIAGIIQARMGSTRLPGKVLMKISKYPMLWHVISRVQQASILDHVVVATSEAEADEPVVTLCREIETACFRGSEDDVLDRFYQTAHAIDADIIVRVTADCPLLDPNVLEKTVELFQASPCDYASNTIDRTFPDGLDVEVFSFTALAQAWGEAQLMSEREHVTSYIWKNPELFNIQQYTQDQSLSHLRWTVDEPEDMEFVRCVYKHLYQPGHTFLMEDVVKLLEEHPELLAI